MEPVSRPEGDGRPDGPRAGDDRPLLDVARLVGDELTLRGLVQRIARASLDLVDASSASVEVRSPGEECERAGDGEPGGTGSRHEIPMRYDGPPDEHDEQDVTVEGLITVVERDGHALTDAEVRSLERLAAVAATAVRNTRLYQQAERRRRRAMVAARLSETLLSTDAADPVPDLLTAARDEAGADFAAVLLPRDGQVLQVRATEGLGAHRRVGRHVEVGSPAAAVLWEASGRRVDPGRADGATSRRNGGGPQAFVPLLSHGRPVGVLEVGRVTGRPGFSDLEMEALADYARFAGVAVALVAARNDRERLRAASERDRLLEEINTNVVRRLFAVGMSLGSLVEQLREESLRGRVEATIDEIDVVIRVLRSAVFRTERPSSSRLTKVPSQGGGSAVAEP